MVRQGDIVLVELGNKIGSEYGKNRPAVIVQDDIYNEYFNTTIVALITGKIIPEYTVNVFLSRKESKLSKDSMVLTNQLRTIDKVRIQKVVGSLSSLTIHKIKFSLKRVFGF